jgi:hypothetical protein
MTPALIAAGGDVPHDPFGLFESEIVTPYNPAVLQAVQDRMNP